MLIVEDVGCATRVRQHTRRLRDGTATGDHDGAFSAAADCDAAGLLGLQLTAEYCRKTHWIKKVLPEQPFSGLMQDFFFCQEYPDKQQIIFEFDLSGR